MKRYSVQRAYEPVRPNEDARNRMLRNILLSSEISPAGKDEQTMQKKMKPIVIAAIIVAMVMLMGCTLILFRMQDMKIGEYITRGEILDSEGKVLVKKENIKDVYSLHGIMNSPTFLAHQEWFAFYEDYSQNHVITEEEDDFVEPEEYEAYEAYNQELMDKIDEIAGKYNLNLLGAVAPFQQWENEVFYEATGIDSVLMPDSTATIEKESGYFYEAGNFKMEFLMKMPEAGSKWSYEMMNTIYYSKQDNFDTVEFSIGDPQDWEEWNYTTSSGMDILIARSKTGDGIKVFCVREDAIIYVDINDLRENWELNVSDMTKRQLELLAEQFDYSMKVESVDMDIAREKLGRFKNK